MRRVLILGGTTEARELAARLAQERRLAVTLSLAGRTQQIREQPVPVRVGGFGGAQGLAAHLRAECIDALIDATHPYAAQISRNAVEAARAAGTPLLALRRPGWQPQAGDRWEEVEGPEAAVAALGVQRKRVFLALGRQLLEPFARAPQHDYLVRSVDPVDPALRWPRAVYLLERGPFHEPAERALLLEHGIERLVSRNSGGDAAYAKLAAARALGIAVLLLRRPLLPDAESTASVEAAQRWVVGTALG